MSGRYDAFISYSHRADGGLAESIQVGLERLVKPWYRRRPFLRVFRDETSFAAGSDLGERIKDALDASDHLVLLLSPEAAASPWVDQEVEHWLASRDSRTVTPVITSWSAADGTPHGDMGAFNWAGDVLPPRLRGVFKEPLYVDMRWASASGPLTLANERFKNNIASIAAAVRGQNKDDLVGALVAMQTRARVLTGTIALALVILLGGIGLTVPAWVTARAATQEARRSLVGVNADLANAQGRLATVDVQLARANDRLAAATSALGDAEVAVAAAQTRLDALQTSLDVSAEELNAATQAKADALAQRDAALTGAQDAKAQRDAALTSAQDAKAQRDAALTGAQDARAQRDALNLQAVAARLASESRRANEQHDSALGLTLAAEAMNTTQPPTAAAYRAMREARDSFALRRSQRVGNPIRGSSGNVTAVVFSEDRSHVLYVDDRMGIQSVDLTTHASETLQWSKTDSRTGAHAITAFSPDGSTIAVRSLGDPTTVLLLDLATGRELQSVSLGGPLISSIEYGPSKLIILELSAPDHHQFVLWDLNSNLTTASFIDAKVPSYQPLQFGGFTEDGQVLFFDVGVDVMVGNPPNAVKYMAALSIELCKISGSNIGQCVPNTFEDSNLWFGYGSIRISPDGGTVVISDGSGLVALLDLQTKSWRINGFGGGGIQGFPPLIFARSGQEVITPIIGGGVGTWDATTGHATGTVGQEFGILKGYVTALAYDNATQMLAAADSSGILEIFDFQTGTPVGGASLLHGEAYPDYPFSTTPDGTALVLPGLETSRVMAYPSGVELATLPSAGEVDLGMRHLRVGASIYEYPGFSFVRKYEADAIAMATESDVLALARQGAISFVAPATGVGLRADIEIGRPVRRMSLSADGRTLAVADSLGEITIWNTITGAKRSAQSGNAVSQMVMSADGSMLAWTESSSEDRVGTVFLWHVGSGAPPAALHLSQSVGSLDFNSSGSLLLVGGGQAIWDTDSLEAVSGPVSKPLWNGGYVGAFVGASDSFLGTVVISIPVDAFSDELALWDYLDVGVACDLAAPYMTGRDLSPYLPTDRAASACAR